MQHAIETIEEAQRPAAAPAEWLSPGEREHLAAIPHAERRAEWLAGRRVLKRLLGGALPDARPADLHIESRDGAGRPTTPRVFHRGKQLAASVSVAHAGGLVMAVVARAGMPRIGCDLTPINNAFGRLARCWFTDEETDWLRRGDGAWRGAVVWGLKESLYKALGGGEPFRPRRWDTLATLRRLGVAVPPDLGPNNDRAGGTGSPRQRRLRGPRAELVIEEIHNCIAAAVAVHRAGPRRRRGPLPPRTSTLTGAPA